ncbi:MAG: hypothetical protein BGP10_12270 [Rhodanobacter sp. 68-29]|nr:MAG: hypothetical protein ABT19_00190 [Rhodanobacter sp. SCN 68-63]OJY60667.1 MAG: hypothetical protein BGP10_12270 [Rhodanobacter sp. 68-29]
MVPPTAAKTIHFADHGQDFLAWDVAADGVVLDVRPYQGWLWKGCKVINLAELAPGGIVMFTRPGDGEHALTIKHPVADVTDAAVSA